MSLPVTTDASPSRLLPEVSALLDTFSGLELPDFADMSPNEARQALASLRVSADELPAVHSAEELNVPTDIGSIPVRIYRPSDASNLPVLVWFHGGGWVLGDLDSGELPCRDLVNRVGCVVVSVGYRLAPEHPFPAAYDDCYAVTRWVADNAKMLGVDRLRVAVGGDSAGANLAACVAVGAAADGLALRHQLLVYPVIDATFRYKSYEENGDGYFLTTRSMEAFWDHYTDPAQRTDARVAPLSGDLSAVAPTWLFVAEFDPLRDEGLAYADALRAAGVPVERYFGAGMIHGVFGMTLACAAEVRADAARALHGAFGTRAAAA